MENLQTNTSSHGLDHSSIFYEEVNFFNPTSKSSDTQSYKPGEIRLFYDIYSKNIIRITPSEIEIYNKQARVLKKMIKINLTVHEIVSCTIENSLNYLIISFDTLILVLDINTKKKDILEYMLIKQYIEPMKKSLLTDTKNMILKLLLTG